MPPPDRKPIGYCQVCFEEQAEPVLAYFRRNYTDPSTGKYVEAVPMCKRHSNKVTRYGNPYERRQLTPEQRDQLVAEYEAGGVTTREVAERWNVHFAYVAKLVRQARAEKKRRKGLDGA